MTWYWVDYAILAILALSVFTGLVRGFIKELLALSIWILAIWLAFNYAKYYESWVQPYIEEPTIRLAVAFIVILLLTLIIGGACNALISYVLKRSGLSSTDRILGVAFGFARGVLIVALLMLVIQLTSLPHEEYSKQSRIYATFDPLVHWMSQFVPDVVKRIKVYDPQENTIDIAYSP